MKTALTIIIGLSIYIPLFVFFYLKFKERYSKTKRVILSGVLSYLITGFITVLFIVLMSNYDGYLPDNKKFNSVEFKNNSKHRLSMKNDIVESKLLLNKTKPDIKKLLGTPSETKDGKWHYLLGSKGLLSPTFYILELSFNKETCNDVNLKIIDDN